MYYTTWLMLITVTLSIYRNVRVWFPLFGWERAGGGAGKSPYWYPATAAHNHLSTPANTHGGHTRTLFLLPPLGSTRVLHLRFRLFVQDVRHRAIVERFHRLRVAFVLCALRGPLPLLLSTLTNDDNRVVLNGLGARSLRSRHERYLCSARNCRTRVRSLFVCIYLLLGIIWTLRPTPTGSNTLQAGHGRCYHEGAMNARHHLAEPNLAAVQCLRRPLSDGHYLSSAHRRTRESEGTCLAHARCTTEQCAARRCKHRRALHLHLHHNRVT